MYLILIFTCTNLNALLYSTAKYTFLGNNISMQTHICAGRLATTVLALAITWAMVHIAVWFQGKSSAGRTVNGTVTSLCGLGPTAAATTCKGVIVSLLTLQDQVKYLHYN